MDTGHKQSDQPASPGYLSNLNQSDGHDGPSVTRELDPLCGEILVALRDAEQRGVRATVEGLATRLGRNAYSVGARVNLLVRLGAAIRHPDGRVELGWPFLVLGSVS